jgi:hypothetical protein
MFYFKAISTAPRKARVVDLRYFGRLSVEEAAEVLHVHPNRHSRLGPPAQVAQA